MNQTTFTWNATEAFIWTQLVIEERHLICLSVTLAFLPKRLFWYMGDSQRMATWQPSAQRILLSGSSGDPTSLHLTSFQVKTRPRIISQNQTWDWIQCMSFIVFEFLSVFVILGFHFISFHFRWLDCSSMLRLSVQAHDKEYDRFQKTQLCWLFLLFTKILVRPEIAYFLTCLTLFLSVVHLTSFNPMLCMCVY